MSKSILVINSPEGCHECPLTLAKQNTINCLVAPKEQINNVASNVYFETKFYRVEETLYTWFIQSITSSSK